MEDNKNKKIIIMVVGIFVLLIALITATYAWFSSTSSVTSGDITTAKEELELDIKGTTHVSNIKPTSDFVVGNICSRRVSPFSGFVDDYTVCPAPPIAVEEGPNRTNKDVVSIPMTVTSNSTVDIKYNLYIDLENLELNDKLSGGTTEDIKWVLHNFSSESSSSTRPKTFGDFYEPERKQTMLYEVPIKPKETHYYLLYVYINESNEDQNKLQKASFDVNISVDTKKLDVVGRKLSEVVLENNIIKDREPSYKIANNPDENGWLRLLSLDKGLFKVQNTDKNIYYFRGVLPYNNNDGYNTNVISEHVYFGRYKANDNIFNFDSSYDEGIPIEWQILRINDDGSVVLFPLIDSIYLTKTFEWKTDNGKSDYEGSNIKQELETWFNTTFTEKEKNMIKQTTYCNDRSESYNGVKNRLAKDNPEPTLECKDENDRINSQIGLLTADEIVMAGGFDSSYTSNKKLYYDYDRDYGNLFMDVRSMSTFTMSPSSSDSIYYYVFSSIDENTTSERGYIYPVITLKSEVTISKGITFDSEFYPTGFDAEGYYDYYVGYDE